MHFLQKLREANVARDKEWNIGSKPLPLIFFANELGGEVGEACNVLKKLDREFNYQIKGSRDTLEHLAEEMADIVICCDLFAMRADIDFKPDLAWPSTKVRGPHDYSLYGASMMSIAGRVCEMALDPGRRKEKMEHTVGGLVWSAKIYCDRMEINLAAQVVQKFNLTSYKVGLATMMSVEDAT